MVIFCRKKWIKEVIPVKKQEEPKNFYSEVRIPGQKYLKNNPRPKSKEFSKHDYWRNINPELYQLYNGICAYTGMWFSGNDKSVDHFLPKSKNPELAYEWDNYRLTTQRMNNTKGDEVNLVDPFEVKPDWFILDLDTYLIKPNKILAHSDQEKIMNTIKVLRLNRDDDRVENRREIIQGYKDKVFNFEIKKEKYPYIAYEIKRQGLL
jgi:uncharacterized protein (TIGR02646 family)